MPPIKTRLDQFRVDLRARVQEAHKDGNYLTQEDYNIVSMLIELWAYTNDQSEDPTELENRLCDFEEAVTQGLIEVSSEVDEVVGEAPVEEEEEESNPPIQCRTFEITHDTSRS